MNNDFPYAEPPASEQAESSKANLAAGTINMRILVELQVISMLLIQAGGSTTEDLAMLRKNVATSIT